MHRRLYDNLSVVALDVEDIVPGEGRRVHMIMALLCNAYLPPT